MLTMSITPPRGWVINPSRPLPIPLKNPSTPSSEAPANTQNTTHWLQNQLFEIKVLGLQNIYDNREQLIHRLLQHDNISYNLHADISAKKIIKNTGSAHKLSINF